MEQIVSENPKRKRDYRVSVLKMSTKACIPVIIGILLLAYAEYNREIAQRLDNIKQTEKHQVEIIHANMSGRLNEAISNIKSLGASPLSKQVLLHPENEAIRNTLVQELEVLAITSNIHDQIRIFKLNGDEVLRVNYRNNKTDVLPNSKLQNKKHRYYFQDSLKLKPGQIYISEMDLNIEYGKIEVPYVPIIRLAMKIYTEAGKCIGIATLNYKADLLCDMFAESTNFLQGDTFLLNSDGYYLAGGNPKNQWAFMFDDKKHLSYAAQYPDFWKDIRQKSNGQFSKNGFIVTYQTIDNLIMKPSRPHKNIKHEESHNLQLIVVSQISPGKVTSLISGIKFKVIMLSGIIAIFLVTVITGIIVFKNQRDFMTLQNQAHAEALVKQSKQLAADIQNMLLLEPVTDQSKYYEFAQLLKSCNHVGGDFIGYWKFEAAADILIGDVMGKGVAGALLAAATKIQFANSFRDSFLTQHHLPTPAQIVDYVRTNISDTLFQLERFVSLNFARLDLENRAVEFIDCGHTRPILYRPREDKIIFLEGENMPLGFDPNDKAVQIKYDIQPNDLLIFYSDGVTETRKYDTRELFGINRLVEFIRSSSHLSASQILENLQSTLATYQNSDIFTDDLTCIVVRIKQLP